jgi:protein-tyrosine phosphatase
VFPLADVHVHLLAGLDDGPRDPGEAEAMCHMLVADGVAHATALAHQNPSWPDNTPERIRTAADSLKAMLAEKKIPLAVYPTAEVVLTSTLVEDWKAGKLVSVSDQKKYLLVEEPHKLFLDYRLAANELRGLGIRVIVAHAERYPELLHDPELTALWIKAGCLIQVSTQALAAPSAYDEPALKEWATRGMIHLLGTDGHRTDFRPPRYAAGYRRLEKWVGAPAAERIGGIWGSAVLQGLPVNPPPPKEKTKSWFTKLFGG